MIPPVLVRADTPGLAVMELKHGHSSLRITQLDV